MPRRFAFLLLSLALLLGGMAAAPCIGNAACLMAMKRPMNCCAAKTGISQPSCCGKQVRRDSAPVTPDRPVQSSLSAPGAQLAPIVATLRDPAHRVVGRQIDVCAAPPGGSLIAQHTSLLL